MARPQPTIAVKESREDLLEIGPSTGLKGGDYGLVYVIGKGLYQWNSGDQSGNISGGNSADDWVAPSEDTSGASGAWNLINAEFIDEDDMASDSDTAVPTQQSTAAFVNTFTAGHIDGLELSNGTDSDHDIDIATGVCSMRDGSGNRKLFQLTSGLTKQIDANWAEGTDAGGFPSGLTLSADTHYHVLLIGKDDGSVDAGFDTDASASNLLTDASSYSWFRRIGSVFTDGSSNILSFTQTGDLFFWLTPPTDIDDSSLETSAVLAAMSVPPGQLGLFYTLIEDGADNHVWISSPDNNNLGAGEANATLKTSSGSTAAVASIVLRVDSSSQIRYRSDTTNTANAFYVRTTGWIDDRGRNQ